MEKRSEWKMLDRECFRIYAPCHDPDSNMDGFEFYQLRQEYDREGDNKLYYVMHLEVFPDYPDYPQPCPNGPQYIYAPDALQFCGVESLDELKEKFGDGWRLKLAEAWFEICVDEWMISAEEPLPWEQGVKLICEKTGYCP